MPSRPEFGDDIGAGPAFLGDFLGQLEHLRVGVEPDQVECRTIVIQLVEHIGILAADNRPSPGARDPPA